MFVIDTNVASELMRSAPASTVAAWIAERDAEELFLTAVSEAELLYGVAIMPAGRRRTMLEDSMTRWLDLGFVERFCRSTALLPEPMRRSRPTGAARVGRLERSTARLPPYPARAAPSW